MADTLDTRFVGGLADNTRAAMAELLNERLADTVALTLAVKQAHWNLKGPGFIGVHELLDEVAERLRESSDTIAERCQVIGGTARGTVEAVAKTSKMQAYPLDTVHVSEHVTTLTDRFSEVGARVREAIDAAGEAGDEDTADLFTEVSRQIDKDGWFIGANVAP